MYLFMFKIMFIARPNVFYTLCYWGLGLDFFGAFLRLEDLFTKRELAPYSFSWQWRFVSLSCRQYPHVFYIAYFNVHFLLFFNICSLYLLCCVIDDREHAIDICKLYVNHFNFYFQCQCSNRVKYWCHCSGPNILPD